MGRYRVIVGNVGTVWSGDDETEARKEYADAVESSKLPGGRDGGEPVTLMCDGEIACEYEGTNDRDRRRQEALDSIED